MTAVAAQRCTKLLLIVSAVVIATGCKATTAAAKPSPWRPLARQSDDRATTFLLDPAMARRQRLGDAGPILADAPEEDPWRPNPNIAVVAGRYRLGIQSTNPYYGYVWMPSTGILSPRAFTVEFWVKSAVPFESAGGTPVSVSGIAFGFSEGTLIASFVNEDTYPSSTFNVNANVRALPANVWEEFALSYADQTLTLYVNGRVAATAPNVVAPQTWSDINRGGGLTIGGSDGKGATEFAISELRISRVARVPGRSAAPASRLSVTFDSTGAGIRQSLLGGLHTLTTPATVRMARGVFRVIRTDKLINSTPIKVGPPDAAHPSRGISGIYSYNWAVVDRTMQYLKGLGVEPYLSIDSTPQVLGGYSPPFSGTLLSTARSYIAGFNSQVPDNLQAWQAIVSDLAFHILKQDHVSVAYWGVWNEPDGTEFWGGGVTEYLSLYQATVEGIRSVDPTAIVGGAETSSWQPQWVSALMAYCAAQQLPLNFISWHYYSGDLGEIAEAEATVASLARRYGMARPFLNIGEWAWQVANLPGAGTLPFSAENYFINDWSAAFVGASLTEMQRDDVVTSIYTNPVASRDASGYAASGLMSPRGPWATFNVYRLWHMLSGHEVRLDLNADPGVFAIAAKDRRQLGVMVVSLHYELGRRYPLTLTFPRRLAGRPVRVWLVDSHHADAYDAGPRHADLRPSVSRLSGSGTLRLSLAARAVVLVQTPLS